jgi:hypothetical protein
MLQFKDIANSREYKRNSLLKISFEHDNFFENAIEENIKSLKENIKLSKEKFEELSDKTDGKEVSTLTSEEEESIHEACYHEGNIESFSEHLYSLNEMRVIYLFKNLEISIKSIIKDAYPNTDTKDFFKWQSLIAFLEEKNISVTNIDGYADAVQLKDVNNALKHSDSVPQHIVKVSEFVSGFNSDGLERFAQRIRPRVELFREKLSAQIAKERYDFDESRIDSIVKEFHYRMDKEAFLTLIQKLNSKIATSK